MSAKRKSPPSKLAEAEGDSEAARTEAGGELSSDGGDSSSSGGGLSPGLESAGAGDPEVQSQRRSMESVLRRLSSRLLEEAGTPASSA